MNSIHAILWAVTQAGGAAQPGAGGFGQMIFMLGGMFLIFYLLLIRPQQKRQKEHQKMLDALKKGDEVITSGGVLGRVHSITDQIVTLEVAEKVRIRVTRSSVSTLRSNGSTEKSGGN